MRIGIDIGGTFTDFVLYDETKKELRSWKVLSSPHRPEEAVLEGLSRLSLSGRVYIVHGSTVATNALLERKGAKTALITTEGFSDVLAIGRQNREHLFDLRARRPAPLVPEALRTEVRERVTYRGEVLLPLQEEDLPGLAEFFRRERVESVAICLLFSFLYPGHENLVGDYMRRNGFFVSLSREVLPEFREYERMSATVINGYVSPVLSRYLEKLTHNLERADIRIMQSNGGSIKADLACRQGIRSVLSGPAGGVVGAKEAAERAGFSRVITFDMGGTSTDVSICDGEISVNAEGSVGGLPVRTPVLDIHTVGAGGGSLALLDEGGALRVGPESAGALPGPVCYGRNGEVPTVTDANLVLGRISPRHFLGGRMDLDYEGAYRVLETLGHDSCFVLDKERLGPARAAAWGIVQVANAHMERALRVMTVERGLDPTEFVMVSFGGAGGLHACDLARLLAVKKVMIPCAAATLSAYGMLCADVIKDYCRTVMLPHDTDYRKLSALLSPKEEELREEVAVQLAGDMEIEVRREADLRYCGQSYELTVPLDRQFLENFHVAHLKNYGYAMQENAVDIVNLRLRVIGKTRPPLAAKRALSPIERERICLGHEDVVLSAGLKRTPFYAGDLLTAGNRICGPAVVVKSDTTVFLDKNDQLLVDALGNFLVSVNPV